jgi:guanine deaminase
MPAAKNEEELPPVEGDGKPAHEKGSDDLVNEAFMKAAAMSAIAGVRIGHGGPFGASIVRDGVIIACAHNMVLHRCDPCCHAEMNAISQACRAMGTHDLSDCDLYTTCEPCPMCWGAVQWSRLNKAYIGADRYTAAKYGFDDKVFYDEIDTQGKASYGLRRTGFIPDTVELEKAGQTQEGGLKRQVSPGASMRVDKGMVMVYDGILEKECTELFTNPEFNKTLKRRFFNPAGRKLHKAHSEVFADEPSRERSKPNVSKGGMETHEGFMRHAIETAKRGVRDGRSKEREPFAAVIVQGGNIVSEACNTVLSDRDATATAEVNAIRAATQRLETHNLSGCDIYCTVHPDLMSLGAILWARIDNVYCGVTQQVAAQSGFEEGIIHFKDLIETIDNEHKITDVVEGVAKDDCEKVFQEWSDRNGVIY